MQVYIYGFFFFLLFMFSFEGLLVYFLSKRQIFNPLREPLKEKITFKILSWFLWRIKVLITEISTGEKFIFEFSNSGGGESYEMYIRDFKRSNLSFVINKNYHQKGVLYNRITFEKEYSKEYKDLIIYSNNEKFINGFSATELEKINYFVNAGEWAPSISKKKNRSVIISFSAVLRKLNPDFFLSLIDIIKGINSKISRY